ncbi:MAG: RNA-directed DNA polymerase [Muribaculaceae bacterium]|nr:RNA-directed DNA polymerase [Muribaculaceae bacterium]
MDTSAIQQSVQLLRSRGDLLYLLNDIITDAYGSQAATINMRQLNYYSNPNRCKGRYRSFQIPKKSGGTRTISAPCKSLKYILRIVNILLQAVHKPSTAAKGFVPRLSIVDNAAPHVGKNYVLNLDLKDFFPSISEARVRARLMAKPFNFTDEVATTLAGLCSYRPYSKETAHQRIAPCVLPQGAPTSPTLTNAICDRLDMLLSGVARRFNLTYTRYADDITFSSNHYVFSRDGEFMTEVRRIIAGQGFEINEKKTRLQRRHEHQEVTGLTVNEKVNTARRYARDIRNLLYIWNYHGIADAERSFLWNYDKPQRRVPDMINAISGKLEYLKMVKGANDPVYVRLSKKFESLQNGNTVLGYKIHKTWTINRFRFTHGYISVGYERNELLDRLKYDDIPDLFKNAVCIDGPHPYFYIEKRIKYQGQLYLHRQFLRVLRNIETEFLEFLNGGECRRTFFVSECTRKTKDCRLWKGFLVHHAISRDGSHFL